MDENSVYVIEWAEIWWRICLQQFNGHLSIDMFSANLVDSYTLLININYTSIIINDACSFCKSKALWTVRWWVLRASKPSRAGTPSVTTSNVTIIVGTPGGLYGGCCVEPKERYVAFENFKPFCDGLQFILFCSDAFVIRLNNFNPVTNRSAPVPSHNQTSGNEPFRLYLCHLQRVSSFLCIF